MRYTPFLVLLCLFFVCSCNKSGNNGEQVNRIDTTLSDTGKQYSRGKVLFVLTSHGTLGNTGDSTGFYLSEAAYPWKVISEAGYEVDYVSPEGGMPPVDGKDLPDSVNKEFRADSTVRKKLQNTMKPGEVDPSDYKAIYYVGGHGAMWDFPENQKLAGIAAEIYEDKGIIGAVCHGPAGLLNIRLSNGKYLLTGKKVAAFTNEEEKAVNKDSIVPFLLADKLKERGARHIPGKKFEENVIRDGRLVTGQNPASAKKTAEKIVKLLENR